jgi:hypothetical protein
MMDGTGNEIIIVFAEVQLQAVSLVDVFEDEHCVIKSVTRLAHAPLSYLV